MAKVALLIGVAKYEDAGLNPLPSAIKDVESMQRVLENPELGNFNLVTTLLNPQRQEMEDAIYELFANCKKEDLLLFYFSGHGLKDEAGKFYMSTSITRKNNGRLVRHTAIAASFLQENIYESKSKRIVVILDSSFSGAIAQGVNISRTEMAFLTSSTSTQFSFEQQGLEESIYTHYLVEGIETGAADHDGDGWIALYGLHEYASNKVQEAAPAMTPQFYPIGEGYKIVVAKAPVSNPTQRNKLKLKETVDYENEITSQEKNELEKLKQDLDNQRIQLELERAKLKEDFYNSIIQLKNWHSFVLHLKNNPEDAGLILQLFKTQQQINKNDITAFLTLLLDNDDLKQFRSGESGKILLQELTRLSEEQNILVGTRDALIVGINRYPFLKNSLTAKAHHLQAPAYNAEAVAQLLEAYGDFLVRRLPVTNIDGKLQVDPNIPVKAQELEEAIINLFLPESRKPADTALLYFSGHGLRKTRGISEGYLATSDASPSKGLYGISLQWLRRLLQESKVRQPIIILDCSHSGELLNFDEVDAWNKNKTYSSCFIASSREFEDSYQTPDNKHGVFTTALLKGLEPKKENFVTNHNLVDFLNRERLLLPQRPIFANYGEPIIITSRLLVETKKLSLLQESLTYDLWLDVSQNVVSVGEELDITLHQNQPRADNNSSYLLEIPYEEAIANELNLIINAPGFQINGDNTASLPLDTYTVQETQTARFRLTALRPGNATITAELYRGDTFETKLETQIQVAEIDEATFIPQCITTQPRPVPQPDFILRIQTIWNETNSTCKFQYQLRSFRFPSVFPGNNMYTSDSLSTNWLEQTRGLLATTLENTSGSLPTEGKSRLISLGQYLFEQVFPTELQNEFRSLIPQNSTFTLLIIADQEAWIPWELLYDGQRFLGDRFIISRWLQELNDTRPYEFPVGTVDIAHYANVEQPQLWATLLEAHGAPPPQPLPAGVLHDSTEAIRGLHLIRYSQSSDAANLRNAPVTLDNINDTEDIELQMRPAKLNLRRNRPFVTLSYVKTDTSELTALENTWASAFIRAGCSGFTGSLWAVEPAVEAAFISSFYNRLWAGASLGEAFYTSRQLARAAAPDSLDWLAYVLFGDPMARPYRPVPGDGYAIVEPIGREIDDPLPPGAIARFRVTLRRNPPVWHEDRVIEVAEHLVFENLQVHIVTYGLQVIPDLPITMTLTAKGDYLGWFTLAVPNEITETSALVQVYFADGMRPIHSLNFSLNIENGREE
ncbi:caspase family protein [Tolypothrix sp. VBCCA 56010]|uniref:caspase family protein n=1 Tax=Tolypothrix sp. VBCCA 56010 TaxID=3137731 RepID=UPI003D7D2F65